MPAGMIREALFVLAGFVVLGTLLPLVHTTRWWIRVLDFPRLQMAALGAVVLVALLALPSNGDDALVVVFSSTLGICVLFQVSRILPYTPLGDREVESAYPFADGESGPPGLDLLICNVLMDNRDAEPLKEVIRVESPDLVLLVEADAWWRDAVGEAVAGLPHRIEHPQDNTYGMLLYSRLPLRDARVEFLTEEGVPSIFTGVELDPGATIDLACLHPRPPRPDKLQDTDQRDAELLAVGKRLQHSDRPTVVAGDLNDVAWSRTTRAFQRLSGLLDPRRGRGLVNTFHADHVWLRYPLDHIFLSSHFRLRELKRLRHVGSDHFPVVVRIDLAP